MHTVTNELRKETHIFSGDSGNGHYDGFTIELFEVIYNKKDGTKRYTNYRATFFAKTEKMSDYLKRVLVPGRTVTIAAASLDIKKFTSNSTGDVHVTLDMIEPKIDFSSFSVNNNTNAGQSNNGNSSGWGQPQQPQRQNNQGGNQSQKNTGSNSNDAPMDFDDDIPF